MCRSEGKEMKRHVKRNEKGGRGGGERENSCILKVVTKKAEPRNMVWAGKRETSIKTTGMYSHSYRNLYT